VSESPIRRARREARQRERERQGVAVPACALCIEDHHTVGRHHDDLLKAPLCQRHHREIHEQLRRAEVSLRSEPDKNKRVAKALRAAAVYDRARADAMERWASLLTHQ
jgi:hypothetical protein